MELKAFTFIKVKHVAPRQLSLYFPEVPNFILHSNFGGKG